jgi:hypothetical protein
MKKISNVYQNTIGEEDFACIKIPLVRNSRGTKWEARRTARHSDKPRWRACKVKLHHFVLNISPNEMPAGHVVDHINGDSLDNRKSNLEIVTQRVNMERAGVLPKRGHLELPNF